MLVYLVLLALNGLVVGALGRLAIPGPNPMSIPKTILIGIGGSFLGGLVGYAVLGERAPSFLFAVLAAAGIVYLLERNAAKRV